MRLTHLGHSAVLVETTGARVLIDPGNFSEEWHPLTGLDAVILTHAHPDHADPEWLPRLLDANPAAVVLAEAGVLAAVDLPGARRFGVGDVVTVGGATIEGVGGQHAVIHAEIPRIGNTGVVITKPGGPRFFHPGDALDTVPPAIDVLAIPAYGPWAAMKETIDFVRAVGAPRGFLIHEGLINERGWALRFARLNEMTTTAVADLRGAGPVDYV